MAKKLMDLVGRRFGKLVVKKEIEAIHFSNGKRIRRWQTLCDCGNTHDVDHLHLTRKNLNTTSCGCVGKTKKFATKNTDHYRRLYNVWHKMKFRCEKRYCSDYPKYGARGIRVSDAWQSFGQFYNDMIDSYKPGLTIERVDVNGNYCKENCVWISNEDQAKNRRTTVWVNGMCAKDACREAGISYEVFLRTKNRHGKDPQELFNEMVAH